MLCSNLSSVQFLIPFVIVYGKGSSTYSHFPHSASTFVFFFLVGGGGGGGGGGSWMLVMNPVNMSTAPNNINVCRQWYKTKNIKIQPRIKLNHNIGTA